MIQTQELDKLEEDGDVSCEKRLGTRAKTESLSVAIVCGEKKNC